MEYNRKQICDQIRIALEGGKSIADALDLFLMMNMNNDLTNECTSIKSGPSPSDVHMNLIGNGVIDKDDIQLKSIQNKKSITQKLIVKLSPGCTLYAEMYYLTLQVTINEKNATSIYLKSYKAEDVALWMIRQKQNLDKYMKEWDAVLDEVCKKTKSKRLATLAIRALFTEGMKDHPHIEYEFVEQERRVRIKVKIPDTHLGVYLDAWWGSYRERLPRQIESLKQIIETHSKSTITNYFIYY